MNRLEGKSALITGAARGIGLAFARRFVQEGATVAIGDINVAGAEAAASELSADAWAVDLDVTLQESIDKAIQSIIEKSGGIDIRINNAAVFDQAAIVDISRKSFEKLFAINTAGTLFTMQVADRAVIARDEGGKIINMASLAGRRGEPLLGIYCASKLAVISLTQSAGLNLKLSTEGLI